MSVAVGQERVSNERLRREFERGRAGGWLTSDLVAVRLGWVGVNGRPEGSRVLRALGLSGCRDKRGRRYVQADLSYERAAELARAMNLDPVDVGL